LTTPLRRQYLDIKKRYPHAILFFRLGDFYETFDEDAETIARELEITLTSRPVSKNQRVPLAGIPYHALDTYLAKLIRKGYKVAICEQTEPPERGKKIVDRRVVRVVTPGTVIEDNLLQEGANNFLAAMVGDSGAYGLAYLDVSTGEFACLDGTAEEVQAELERLAPAELILGPGCTPPPSLSATLTPAPAFDREAAVSALCEQFGETMLQGNGFDIRSSGVAAAGAIVLYLRDNLPSALGHIVRLGSAASRSSMRLDANTIRNLELFSALSPWQKENGARAPVTLLGVLDYTETPMGARLLRRRLSEPLLNVAEIERRLDGVEFFFGSAVRRGKSRQILDRIPDIERLITRISAVAATGTPAQTTARELVSLRRSLEAAAELRRLLESDTATGTPPVQQLLAGLHTCTEAVQVIERAIDDDPQAERAIRAGFSDELDELRTSSGDARQVLAAMERSERERAGIKSLKIGYNRVFGYYIEVSKAHASTVPDDYQRKQTLVNGERYTTRELQNLEYRILHARERQEELETSLLRAVCAQVSQETARILEAAAAVASLDVLAALAEAAVRNGYIRPSVDEGTVIAVRNGRHPVVERVVGEGSYVPNDILLSTADTQIVILTGPNMAGKSTYLREVALIVLMAQTGSFVPAAEAGIGVVDRIFSRVGALDDIATGRSTFMVEMQETAAILHGATPRSLLIFDEIGRGTSTYDGMAIARAVVEFVHNRPDAAARCLFATHYHELTELASHLPRVKNYNVAVAEEGDRVVFLHRILPGGADRSYGVHVAQLAGLPRPVVTRAQEILSELESGVPRQTLAVEAPSLQMALFRQDDGLARELSEMDVDGLTPLQAITRLYELVERARRQRA
jgi:DNA mismatch repair protein MutS